MAFNPSPKVSAARDFAKKFGQKIVIIFHIDGSGKIGYASYGETPGQCKVAKELADKIFDEMAKD